MRNILYFVLLISLFGPFNSFAVEIQKTENKKVADIFDEEDYRAILAKWHDLEILDEEDIETDEKEHIVGKTTNENNKVNQEHDKSSLPKLPDLKILDEEDIETDERVDKTINENNKVNQEHNKSSLPELPNLKILGKEDIEIGDNVKKNINENNKEHDKPSLPKLPDLKTLGKEDIKIGDRVTNENNKEPSLPDLKTLGEETSDKPDRHLVNPVDDEKSLEEKQKRDTQKNTDQIKLPSEIDLSQKPNEVSPPAQQIIQEVPKKTDPSNADNNLQKADQKKESELAVPQNKENTYKTDNQKIRLERPIVEKPKEDNERKELQQWSELKRDPIEKWTHKNTQSKLIYKRQYDSLNEHLPTSVFVHDYSKQLFYCIKKNNLSCLRGIMNKLEKIGLNIEESLKFRNKLGDTPLIYAVKWGEIDMVRFLLLQGSDLNAVNYNFQSAMDIAITKKYVNIINAIAEMTPRLVEYKRINNKKDSAMYNWATNTKEDKVRCGS
ncbi:ankyrin repeat domain-containing protein [Wolbachia endosymbiont of Pentalonia nigronervosa]|uniref:ankyrin repeat domain-containing protein n=1 Tax=Wolbachia endosymbiont of Pentalonia nigronervosa TaxID=1301914 RepID=UPI00165FA06E|nr:ankyrin repeat domain-containing protein [Wolbachia endosymbiont of Pentalonia nigronervosa]MBD0391052.1 ankyrin repeat domain-containing protein [Wolbachia endosymbiont of Pentalonia nigronervosa]